MNTKDYYTYRSAIDAANDAADKEALRRIQMQLIAYYGLNDDDVVTLIKRFRYNV